MRRAAKVALGCLFAPIGFIVIAGVVFLGARSAGVPDPDVGADRVEQPVLEARTELRSVPLETVDPTPATVRDGLRVDLDLVEGFFRIESHDGDEIEVDAEYDRATYELARSYDLDGDMPVFRLKFGSKIHWLRRVASQGGIDSNDFEDNEIVVYLPKGVPIDLRAKVSRGEADFILDGLTLINLVTDLSMGEYSIETKTPNPVVMRRASFELGMGESSLRGLAMLRAQSIVLKGHMGTVRADLGTSLDVDTRIESRMRMGELVLNLPDDALYDDSSSMSAFLGEVDDRDLVSRRVEDPEFARRLTLDGSVLMGEMRVEKFRARKILGGPR